MHLYRLNTGWRRALIGSILAFALVLVVTVVLLNQTDSRVQNQQLATLRNALRRASVTCYALEGRYPPTLEYLTEHYGVVVDADKFIVHYDAFGKNIMPDIMVSPIGGEEPNAS